MNPSKQPETDPGPHLELWLMVGILLVAALFRFYAPNAMPPGPSHDELRMMDLGEMIVEGERPIHWKISYSAEPIFMYLLALAMPIWEFTPFAARLVTRYAGLLLIPVAHCLTRRLFGRRIALFTSGVLAVTWWPLFFSRVALRGITLPLTFAGAIIFLWRGLALEGEGTPKARKKVRWGWLVAGGALMGLTWYTFTAARALTVLLPMLFAYLGLSGPIPLRQLGRIALVTLGIASAVAAPFIYEVRVHPGAPETRLDQLGGVIDRLSAGDLVPFAKQALNTAGLFLVTGDPNWRYNIAERPVFGPVLGALAILGLALSIAHWRQPRHALLILWLLLGLAPSVLTPEAPSFVRGIGALPVVAVFPAIGAVAICDWIALRTGRNLSRLAAVLLILPVPLNGLVTFRESFFVWTARPEVREIYQASLTEAFRDLNHSNLEGPLWVSEPFPDDRHLLLAKRVLHRKAIELRWFDANRALILPPASGARRYLLADFAEPDQRLFARWMGGSTELLERQTDSPASETSTYRLHQAVGGPWVEEELSQIIAQSTASLDLEAEHPVTLPSRFEELATLLGYELVEDRLAPEDQVHVTVYWRVHKPVHEPIASFVHLLDQENNVVGQYDGFDVPPWHWEPGAVIAQVYRFTVDEHAREGPHWLEAGLYHSETMERLMVVDEAGFVLGDRLVLQRVTLE